MRGPAFWVWIEVVISPYPLELVARTNSEIACRR